MGSKLLTEAAIKAEVARAIDSDKRTDIYDRSMRGLILRVTPKGAASFAFAYRPKGAKATARITIGPFPKVTLAQARKIADDHARAFAIGRDPVAERREAVEEAKRAEAELAARVTFGEAWERYLKVHVKRASTNAGYAAVARKNLLPTLERKALADITKRDVQAILDAVLDRGAQQQAGIVYGVIRTFLNWCVSRGYIDASPIAGMKTPQPGKARERFLTVSEIRAFWRILPATLLLDAEKDVLRLQLLLGQRIGEVSGMRRHEVDLARKVWVIPAERSKNKKAHEVPLPPLAREIIERALQNTRGPILFPDRHGQLYRVEQVAMRLLRCQKDFAFKAPDSSPNQFTSHDLRRTVATWMEQSGTPLSIVSAVLNHAGEQKGTVTARHYAHGDVLKAKRLALTKWEVDLRKIFAGEDPFAATFDDADAIEAELMKDAPEVTTNVVTFPARVAS